MLSCTPLRFLSAIQTTVRNCSMNGTARSCARGVNRYLIKLANSIHDFDFDRTALDAPHHQSQAECWWCSSLCMSWLWLAWSQPAQPVLWSVASSSDQTAQCCQQIWFSYVSSGGGLDMTGTPLDCARWSAHLASAPASRSSTAMRDHVSILLKSAK